MFQILIEETDWVDKNLAKDIGRGFNLLGEQPNFGLWRLRDDYQGPELKNPLEWLNSNSNMEFSKPTWMDDEILDQVLKHIKEDTELGRFIPI